MRAYLIAATAAALGVLAAGCTAPNNETAERTEFLAAAMNAITPKDVGYGVTMTAARADGTTLVLAFEGVPPREFESPDYERQAVTTLCDEPNIRKVLATDVDIRVDMTSRDGQQVSVDLEECA